MDRRTRERALRLLEERRSDPRITYADIGRETGHGRRQPMRLSNVLGVSVVDTESYDSWRRFLEAAGDRSVSGVALVTSDTHDGLKRAIREVFQGAAWQHCVVHPVRDCARKAGSRQLGRRVHGIVAPVFRAKDADQVRVMYHLACQARATERGAQRGAQARGGADEKGEPRACGQDGGSIGYRRGFGP